MKKIKVNLAEKSYDIIIGKNALGQLPSVIRKADFRGPVVIFADTAALSRNKPQILAALKKMPNQKCWIHIKGRESSKSFDTYNKSLRLLAAKTSMHKPFIIALGGGVVGDLAGFIASTYRRGVPCIQVPTTLLAQVDSSIGGKTGIDLKEAKNMVGAFHQPKAVIIDTVFLRTLPRRQIVNGLAEVIKYGVISDAKFFSFLEKNIRKILSLDARALEKTISECARIKARTVEKDEFDEKGLRVFLNFGHTLGHAIEAAGGYAGKHHHGEAIAIGMVLAGEIACRLGMFKKSELERMKELIKTVGLAVKIKGVTPENIMQAYKHDKKFTRGINRFVLPRKIGTVTTVENIPEALIRDVVKKYAV